MDIFLPFISAFGLTIFAIFPTIYLAKKYGLVDDPDTRPHPAHVQHRIIPRAGGLAMYIGIVLSILLFVPLEKSVWGIILALTLLLISGLLDDKLKNFSPFIRLVIQFLAAGIVVAAGVGISFISNPLGGVIRLDTFTLPFTLFGPHTIIVLADIMALFWIVWIMNVINWSKGVDGQMPGIIFVAATTIALVAYKLYLNGDPNQFHIATLAIITAGTAAGFLIFNWHPSKIIPAFSGSTILGFMIATLSIMSSAKIAIAVLVLLIPVVDFSYTFFRRLLSGHSPFYGDRGHLHHRLLDLGWSHQRISMFYILSCAILGLAALTFTSFEKTFTFIFVALATLGGIIWLHLLFKK